VLSGSDQQQHNSHITTTRNKQNTASLFLNIFSFLLNAGNMFAVVRAVCIVTCNQLGKWILLFNIHGTLAGKGRNVLGFQFWEGKMSWEYDQGENVRLPLNEQS